MYQLVCYSRPMTPTGKELAVTHSLYVRRNSMNDHSLTVLCAACSDSDFYEVVYDEDMNQTDQSSGTEDYGVPLSVLMTLAEKHTNEVETR